MYCKVNYKCFILLLSSKKEKIILALITPLNMGENKCGVLMPVFNYWKVEGWHENKKFFRCYFLFRVLGVQIQILV